MFKLIFRQAAIDDLEEIWDYTVLKWSENQAEIYYNLIKEAVEHIKQKPTIGKKYLDISFDLLGYKIGKHIVFYSISTKKEIEIIRILHENMDIENKEI